MKNPLQRITGVFIIVALLPVLFIAYELLQLSNNEKIVRETYLNQLDGILFSVNQYSDDIMSSWANRIRQERKPGLQVNTRDEIMSLVNQTDIVQFVYFSDLKGNSVIYQLDSTESNPEHVQSMLDELVKAEEQSVKRLIEYSQAGFRKMSAQKLTIGRNSIPVLFALDQKEGDYAVGAIVINLPGFVKNSLAPKLQSITQGKMVISTFRVDDDSLIYSTNPESVSQTSREDAKFVNEVMKKKDFWVLPGYYVGINLPGASISELVRQRMITSQIMLGLITVVLGTGIYFLYSNIRREIYLSQAKSEFVSNVSHEIRTPLSLIGMFAETLEAGRVTSEEKKKEYYSIIAKETARLSRIVNRILNFSQMEANKKAFNFQPIDLNALTSDILQMYKHPLEEKGFRLEYKPGTIQSIAGDKESVSEAIINLLDNAVKYSHEHKSIEVTTGTDGSSIYLAVQDQGIGIEKAHQRDIFDQFYRAPTGDVHNTKGSGLGLALVKRIMDAHRGEITVVSAPGKGSKFTLWFPTNNQHT